MKMTKELEGIPAAHENPRFCRLRATVLNGLLNALFSKRRSFPLHSFFSDYATLKMLLNGRGDSFLCEQLSQFLILFFYQDVTWLILSSNGYSSGSGPFWTAFLSLPVFYFQSGCNVVEC